MSANNLIHCVKLPKVYPRKEIPVDPLEVATSFKQTKQQQVDCIIDKTASDDVPQEVSQDHGRPHSESWKSL